MTALYIRVLLVAVSFMSHADAVGDQTSKLIEKHHNDLRSTLPAAYMPHMMWDDSLARTAQSWADRCQFKHSQGSYGENLYWSFPAGSNSWEAILNSWWNEIDQYNLNATPAVTWTNLFQIGHFTQMAWDKTTQVGCAWKDCGSGRDSFTISVCNYNPAGNRIGQKPFMRQGEMSRRENKRTQTYL